MKQKKYYYMNKYLFLSHFLNHNTPLYGGKKNTIFSKQHTSIGKGDNSNSKILNFPNHSGTHIDFPYHFSDNGKKLQDYPANFWIFKNIGFIDDSIQNLEVHFDDISNNIEFLIIKTGFEKFRHKKKYWKSQPIFPAYLASKIKTYFPKIRVVGFDMISLTSQLDKSEGKRAHIEFLIKNDILVVEDMNLDSLNSAPEELIVLPLLFDDLDGSPCTIIARF